MRVLVVDDDASTRLLLSRFLRDLGHEVLTATDGVEALDVLEKERIRLVITDWVMPRMDGLELCQRIRKGPFSRYVYMIILTARDTKVELVAAMEAGADDYVTKPFDKSELDVRIRAGERILKLETDLEDRNKRLSNALSIIQRDLEAAAKMQKDLLPCPGCSLPGIAYDWIFLPCSFVAGDTFNFLNLDESHLGFYLLDVAGHGVPAAMLSFTLTKTLSSLSFPGNPLKNLSAESGHYEILPPASAMRELNRIYLADDETMQYFTMIYGIVELESGIVTLCQAGQPHPIHMTGGGRFFLIGQGGFPIGIHSEADFDECRVQLEPGDRLLLYSDGIPDCTDAGGNYYTVERLVETLERWQHLPLGDLTKKVEDSLRSWRGGDEFEDDITLLIMERTSV